MNFMQFDFRINYIVWYMDKCITCIYNKYGIEMSKQLIVRIDKDLKERFKKTSQNEGKASSQVLRELIENYVAEKNLSDYVDDLWGRIGTKLQNKFSVEDIDKVIEKVRKDQ